MKRTSQLRNWLTTFAYYSIAMVAAISGTALCGWLFGSLLFAGIPKSLIPMAPSSALFFLILGGSLLLHLRSSGRQTARMVTSAAALVVAVVSAVIFADYVVDAFELNIEGLIPFATGKLAALTTGRMSPISAANFSLAGLALLLLANPAPPARLYRQAAALLASSVTTIGIVVLLGYLDSSPFLYGGAMIPVALPSALAFIALGVALCSSAGSDIFPQRLFLGGAIRSRLMRAFLPITVVMVLVQGILECRYYPRVTNPSLLSSLMTFLSMTVIGLLIAAISRIISKQMDAAEMKRKLAEQELSASEERFRAFFENSLDAMFFWSPDGTIYSANSEACRVFERTEQEIYAVGFEGLIEPDLLLQEARSERQRTGKYRGELTGRRKGGTKFPLEISSCVFKNKDGQERISSTLRDITQQKRAQEELRESNRQLYLLSNTDPLTHLYNRRYLMESIDREMRRQKRTNSHLTLLLFDVDHFKSVNDIFGHQEGDTVLKAIAGVAQDTLRSNDVAARYGGEEFVLLLPETSLSGGVVVAERLREAIQALSFAAPLNNYPVTVSVGVATMVAANEGVDSLLHKADEALYRAKNGGRNRVEIMKSCLQLAS